MDPINKWIGGGRLTDAPVAKDKGEGRTLTTFSIAVSKSFKKGNEWSKKTSFFDIEIWGRLGETCAQHLEKGQLVRLEGELEQSRWKPESGSARSRVFIAADKVTFGPKAKGGENQNTEADDVPPAPFSEDDIPF